MSSSVPSHMAPKLIPIQEFEGSTSDHEQEATPTSSTLPINISDKTPLLEPDSL